MESFSVSTRLRCQFLDITRQVAKIVSDKGVREGCCIVHIPHTTCGITINENADPDVPTDILAHLARMIPQLSDFRHCEGNSDAHIKTSLMGSAVTVPVSEGRLALGTWQSIFMTEFDGPRTRQVFVTVMAASGAV